MTHSSLAEQNPLQNYHFQQIGVMQGLSHGTVTSIIQDRKSFLWIGTADGLNRYDGYHFKIFKHRVHDSTSLSHNFVNSLFQDRQGRIWIGTIGGGLNCFDPITEKFKHFQYDPDDSTSISNDYVGRVCEDQYGNLWIATRDGLNILPENRMTFIRYYFPKRQITAIFRDRQNNLWFGTEKGLKLLPFNRQQTLDPAHLDTAIISFEHDPQNPGSLAGNFVNLIFEDHLQNLWVSVRGKGLSVLKKENRTAGIFTHFIHNPRNSNTISQNTISAIYEDEQGLIWLGTDGSGLDVYDPHSNRFFHLRHEPGKTNGLSHNNINHIFRDNSGTLWITTWGGGLNKLVRTKFVSYRNDPNNPNSLSCNFVFAIFEDRFGDLWIGTLGGGLNRWQREKGLWKHYKHEPQQTNSICSDNIWAIGEDSDGNLWIGTEGAGIDCLKRTADGQVRRIVHYPPDSAAGPNDGGIRAILQDQRGFLWFATEASGLNCFDRKNNRWYYFRHSESDSTSLSNNKVRALYQDRAGNLWIGTAGGGLNRLLWFSPQKVIFKRYLHQNTHPSGLSHNHVIAITEDQEGHLWIGTYGGGLNKFDVNSETFQSFTEEDGLPNNIVYGVLTDGNGYLWLSTNNGLARFDPGKKEFLNFSVNDGLQNAEFNTGAYFKTRAGELVFGGVNGFNLFKPADITFNRHLPPIVLTSFQISGKTFFSDSSIVEKRVIHLNYDQKVFSFEFAALDFQNPMKNHYAYMLQGFDKSWNYCANRRYASYMNLPPGRYLLKIKGSNNDHLWNEQGHQLAIIIHPPFWRTWWFISGLGVVLSLLIVASVRMRQYYLAYRKAHFIGHFKLIRKIGQGGMGTVYQALDKSDKRIVALKILDAALEESREGLKRFLQEAEIGKSLHHPNIVEIFETGYVQQAHFISMEYLEGRTLKQYIAARKHLPTVEAVAIARQILKGLAEIHRHGIVHRDLKSSNIMVLKGNKIKIMDFGLARTFLLTTMSDGQSFVGTLSYMSPEQTTGMKVDQRSDLFSFGVILYEMIFGELPFKADNEMELIFAIHNQTPIKFKQNHQGPVREILPLLQKCMAKDANDRFASANEILEEISILKLN